jgi:hypothetical protein
LVRGELHRQRTAASELDDVDVYRDSLGALGDGGDDGAARGQRGECTARLGVPGVQAGLPVAWEQGRAPRSHGLAGDASGRLASSWQEWGWD